MSVVKRGKEEVGGLGFYWVKGRSLDGPFCWPDMYGLKFPLVPQDGWYIWGKEERGGLDA